MESNFSWALGLIRDGKRMRRSGWNGKDMFVTLSLVAGLCFLGLSCASFIVAVWSGVVGHYWQSFLLFIAGTILVPFGISLISFGSLFEIFLLS